MRKALANGKHVLCEKSITLNADELDEAIKLAEENQVILAEAMTIFHMPIYRKLSEIIATGKLGGLKLIQMNFGSYKEYDMTNRFFNRQLAGGALLDIGVYALSFVRWFMTSTPTQIASQVKLAPTGVDEQAGILLTNSQGEMATLTLSLHAKQPKRGTIAYDKGYIELYEYPRGQKAVITYTEDGHQEVIEAGSTALALSYEVADMENAVSGQENAMPRLHQRRHGHYDKTPQRLEPHLPRRRMTTHKMSREISPLLYFHPTDSPQSAIISLKERVRRG